MYYVTFYYADLGWIDLPPICGCDIAGDAYLKACELGKLIGANNVALVDALTGEVIAHMDEEE